MKNDTEKLVQKLWDDIEEARELQKISPMQLYQKGREDEAREILSRIKRWKNTTTKLNHST